MKRKRGEKRLTQETLAEDVFGDAGRKGDISRIENGKVTPQEATIQKLCTALDISNAELAPIRMARPDARQLDQIPTLSRDELELLAGRFRVADAVDKSDAELRELLDNKAAEYRDYKAQIDGLDERVAAIANLKGAAQDAAERLNFDEVEDLLSRVDEVETEIAAETKVARARNALMQGKVERAYEILSAAADSFASVDPLEPVRRRLVYEDLLYAHGLRYGGAGMALSEAMIRQALAQVEKGHDPELWAHAQNNLAIALSNQGKRTGGPEGAALLGEAVGAYRAALEVTTRAEHPVDWAMAQNNLGAALRNQGTRTGGPEGAALLGKAVGAYRAALEVRTRAAHSVDWAATQNNLGIALADQGRRTGGPEGAALLGEAVGAYRAALEVRTREAHPVQWAMTQNNLGNALQEQGRRTGGPEGAALLGEAVGAYRAALEVTTRAEHPVDWAMTQENLAIVEVARAELLNGAEARAALERALGHVEGALEVFDPEHMPYNFEKATKLREGILAALGR
ncbi:helix-turn-helix domain-containing protein [Poseidonocella sedimentorum]|uniref:helix-turn-helix domain-containing protein n=1 Tax=Poseidonocella sedimentorum TaxID=871652 RepID=UPI0011604524|nr:helix-turn-helix transcriptional regulator [Poseidonocella sedimentorum]